MFEQTYTSNPVCAQSRAAFMTGWPTHVAGHRTLQSLLHNDEPNMLKYLKKSGYQVMWWGKNDLLAADSFADSVTTATEFGTNPVGSEVDKKMFLFNAAGGGGADATSVDSAIKFLEGRKQGSKPFAIFLPLLAPHPPYSAPEPFHSALKVEDIRPLRSRKLDAKPKFHELIRSYHGIGTKKVELLEKDNSAAEVALTNKLKKVRAVYNGMTSYSDKLFGDLLHAVDKTGHKDNTAIFMWSDHGDYAGDYGLVEKWPSGLEDALTRIPLIARVPGLTGQNKTNTWKEPTQLFDVMATVLELAQIPAEHTHFSKSLTKQLSGKATQEDAREDVFSEGGFASFEPRDLESNCDSHAPPCVPLGHDYYPKLKQQYDHPESVARAIMVRSKTAKLIWRSDPKWGENDSELYNLKEDPDELHNLWGDLKHTSLKNELQEQLLKWLAQTSDVTPWKKDNRNMPR
jgi:arylsulfatase A-like enzyme